MALWAKSTMPTTRRSSLQTSSMRPGTLTRARPASTWSRPAPRSSAAQMAARAFSTLKSPGMGSSTRASQLGVWATKELLPRPDSTSSHQTSARLPATSGPVAEKRSVRSQEAAASRTRSRWSVARFTTAVRACWKIRSLEAK